jgi:hypothetical protein
LGSKATGNRKGVTPRSGMREQAAIIRTGVISQVCYGSLSQASRNESCKLEILQISRQRGFKYVPPGSRVLAGARRLGSGLTKGENENECTYYTYVPMNMNDGRRRGSSLK